MRLSTILLIILSLILNSCAVLSQEKIDKQLLEKIDGKKYNENLYLNKLYISEGHFECSKSQEPLQRFESTGDGIVDNFLYITNESFNFTALIVKYDYIVRYIICSFCNLHFLIFLFISKKILLFLIK